jgi:hypothetical protein
MKKIIGTICLGMALLAVGVNFPSMANIPPNCLANCTAQCRNDNPKNETAFQQCVARGCDYCEGR